MKIAFLHRANDPYTMERMKFFSRRQHSVFSISFSEGGHQSDMEAVEVIRLHRLCIDGVPFLKRLSHFHEIDSLLKRINPDILHVVSALNILYATSHWPKIKVMENQGSDVIVSPKRYRFLVPFYKHYYKHVDGVIQDSVVAYQAGIKYGATKNDERNKVIEIGIDFEIFNKDVPRGVIRERYKLGRRPIVLHTRGISSGYNIDIVVRTLKIVRESFPDVVYILTTTKGRLPIGTQRIIEKENFDANLLFVGFQDRLTDLKYFYRDANVNVSVPSSDSSPFSVYEAMACMTPNVVTDLAWVHSRFTRGKHLLTVPVRDSTKLAEAIIDVMNGVVILNTWEAYQLVFDKVNLNAENSKLEQFYESLLGKVRGTHFGKGDVCGRSNPVTIEHPAG